MIAFEIAVLVVGFIALFLTFKSKFVIEKILKKEPTEKMVLRVKYVASLLAIIAFLSVMILGR